MEKFFKIIFSLLMIAGLLYVTGFVLTKIIPIVLLLGIMCFVYNFLKDEIIKPAQVQLIKKDNIIADDSYDTSSAIDVDFEESDNIND